MARAVRHFGFLAFCIALAVSTGTILERHRKRHSGRPAIADRRALPSGRVRIGEALRRHWPEPGDQQESGGPARRLDHDRKPAIRRDAGYLESAASPQPHRTRYRGALGKPARMIIGRAGHPYRERLGKRIQYRLGWTIKASTVSSPRRAIAFIR